MPQSHVLVVDDEKLLRWSVRDCLLRAGYDVTDAGTVNEALERFRDGSFDLAVLDYMLPDGNGLEVLSALHETNPSLPVVMMTAHSSIDHAVEAMRAGATDYVSKPFQDEDLLLRVERGLETARLKYQVEWVQEEQKKRFSLKTVVGDSPALQGVLRIVERILETADATILIQGESGTGKDVLARAIHFEGARACGPFMNITCTALPESLLESELFGHEKGAFTDARAQKKGLFELADGGTVFLDEIGDMSPQLQSKLLRFLEERAFRRVGASAEMRVDVRVIAATNKDLKTLVKKNEFREDLYFRLKVIPLFLPPLRERKEDVPKLVEHFVDRFRKELKKEVTGVSPEFLRELTEYHWPGNIRELKNTIERVMILSTGEVLDSADLPIDLFDEPKKELESDDDSFRLPARGVKLESVERSLLKQALERTRYNQTKAAKLLGLNRDQIRYRIEKFGLKEGG